MTGNQLTLDGDDLASVVVLRPLDGPFSYLCSEPNLRPGTLVRVPFGGGEVFGVVWNTPPSASGRLKRITEVLRLPELKPELLAFVDRISADTLAPRGSVLKLVLSVPKALERGPYKQLLCWAQDELACSEAATMSIKNTLGKHGPMSTSALAKAAKVGPGKIKALAATGTLRPITVDVDEPDADEQRCEANPPTLTEEQHAAADRLGRLFTSGQSRVALLTGVPGSGKTEVYFDLIDKALSENGQIVVLLPEVVLGAQWLNRFKTRFGFLPLHWHSGMTAAQRRRAWKSVHRGNCPVVVGPRSSLFLPFPSLSLIIVDEEHDASFKQEDGVIYDARRAAVAKAEIEKSMLLFCSATPSLDSLAWIKSSQHPIERLHLRYGVTERPNIEVVDLRRERLPPGTFISQRLSDALANNFDENRQSLLYLNRRGFAPLVLCRACGYRFVCPNCTAWLASHSYRDRLLCHHCGYTRPSPKSCLECGALDYLVPSGPGVERIAQEVRRLLPQARTVTMSSDSVPTAKMATDLVEQIIGHHVDIIVGTQLVTKGHHFPDLTLVGVVDADMALDGNDLRASERCFQLLYQLTGRAGREGRRGSVILQTRIPNHPILSAITKGNYEQFAATEFAERAAAQMPPYARLAALLFSGTDSRQVHLSAKALLNRMPRTQGVRAFGPAPAPLAMLRGRYRVRLLVRADLTVDLPKWLGHSLNGYKPASNVRLAVDMDPQSFF